jgi:hypothetical protein
MDNSDKVAFPQEAVMSFLARRVNKSLEKANLAERQAEKHQMR